MKSFRKSKRGRPKSKIPGPDRGTPEFQAQRLALVGEAGPEYAEYPLGILLARRIIDDVQHDAGCRYGFLMGRVFGRSGAFGALRQSWYSSDLDDALVIVEPL